MILHYLPTHATLEEHIDILPTLGIDAQLITNLIVMMKKLNPGHLFDIHVVHIFWRHLFKCPPCILIISFPAF